MLGKRLTLHDIEQSHEIQSWLKQFSDEDVLTASSMLCRLQFISRDEFSKWLLNKLDEYLQLDNVAIYAIRKFNNKTNCLWQKSGEIWPRPAHTQGSEDFVASIISIAKRKHDNCFMDHPDLSDIKKQKVRNIILVDDSIGSGTRASDFIQLMTAHKTFMSWWNGGFITLHIVSYARTRQSENKILEQTSGSDHGRRKVRLSAKLKFDSDVVYDTEDIHKRWGNSSQAILDLCTKINKIPKRSRKGFGGVMSNIIFFHSVPNNIPGMLIYPKYSKCWMPLFPSRSLPTWTIKLLDNAEPLTESTKTDSGHLRIPSAMSNFLELIKKGLRTKAALSKQLDCDERIVQDLFDQAILLGFISSSNRFLTEAGKKYLIEKQKNNVKIYYDYSLYIPQSWCADQGTVQPSNLGTLEVPGQTDSVDMMSIDGGDGESPLERTDAMAPAAPIVNVTQCPSWARKCHIHYGPGGLRSRWMEPWSAHLLFQNAAKQLDPERAASLQYYTNYLRNQKLPVIFSLRHLGKITGIGYELLHESVNRKRETANYTLFPVKKRSGKRRFIHAVNGKLFYLQKYINQEILQRIEPYSSSFAFHPSGGIKKCAMMHCGCKWLLQFDLRDFFYTISEPSIYKLFVELGYRPLLAFELARLCTTLHLPKSKNHYIKPNSFLSKSAVGSDHGKNFPYYPQKCLGVLPQGSPTSPMLSNLVAKELDKALFDYAQRNGFVYSRYADDLAFSANALPSRKSIAQLKREIISLIRINSFRENPDKFRVAGPGAKKVILGLLVDGSTPRLTKEFKKRIDRNIYSIEKHGIKAAAEHDKFESVHGLFNHISGLMSYVHDVDIEYWEKLHTRFQKIKQSLE